MARVTTISQSSSSSDSEEEQQHTRKPRFFKVIHQDTLRAKMLMLPPRFTQIYGASLSSRATLALPGGVMCRMEVFNDGKGRIWLRNGWQDFATSHSLAYGHLLFFTYRGDSFFSLRIYSITCMEMSYPLTLPADCNATSSQVAQHYCSTYSQEEENQEEEDESDEIAISDFRSRPEKPQGVKFSKGKSVMRRQKCTSRLPSFTAVMFPTYLRLYQCHIPGRFSSKYMKEQVESVVLEIEGKCWNVRLTSHGKNRRYIKFSSGWSEFAKNNSLQVGDECTFEMEKRRDVLVFKVTLVRSRA